MNCKFNLSILTKTATVILFQMKGDMEDCCLICFGPLDQFKTSIDSRTSIDGKRLIIKVFEITKIDFISGSLCRRCTTLIADIEGTFIKFVFN